MTKKMISWLSFMAVFLFLLHSCVHDEIYSSSDPASAEYHSKSLWKEDEKYIKNVMKIYSEHEDNIKKFSGTPDWDYAMSMGKYDESFMVVPIIENGKVVNTLACARFDKKVYFRYENSETNKAFFQNIIYGKYTRYKTDANNTKTNTQKGIVCITKTISMWYPDNESNPNAGGHWETNYYTNCYNYLDYSSPGWEDNGGGGYDYGGGGGSGNNDPNNPNNQTPCEKTKNILNNPELQSAITKMKNQAALPVSAQNYGEIGYKFKADGTSSGMISGGKNEVELGPEAGYQGGYHNHPLMGIKMLSPDDIVKLLNFAMAQPNGSIADAFMGMIGTGADGTEYHYLIQYTGNMQELQQYLYSDNWNLDQLKNDFAKMEDELLGNSLYISYSTGKLNNQGLEKLFFGTLKNMGLENKVNLQRIETNVIKNVTLNSNGTTTANSCPQN